MKQFWALCGLKLAQAFNHKFCNIKPSELDIKLLVESIVTLHSKNWIKIFQAWLFFWRKR